VERKNSFFDLAVSLSEASMLAEVFAPGFHQKRFDKPRWICGITIKSPPESAITSANAPHFTHRMAKFPRPIRINPIFKDD